VYARVGRQELFFGSQRLISSPDGINTRRTFNGAKVYRQGEKFDFDLFGARPVIPNANKLDSVDNDQNFAGVWTTYRPKQGTFIDAYVLVLDGTRPETPRGIDRSPFTVATAVGRFAGDTDGWLHDVEMA